MGLPHGLQVAASIDELHLLAGQRLLGTGAAPPRAAAEEEAEAEVAPVSEAEEDPPAPVPSTSYFLPPTSCLLASVFFVGLHVTW